MTDVLPVSPTHTFDADPAAHEYVDGSQLDTQVANLCNKINEVNQATSLVVDGTNALASHTVGARQLKAELLGMLADGLSPPLEACETVATSNVVLSGPQTINGYALIAGQRVCAVAQTDAKTDGPWVVQAGAWTRPTDFADGAFILANTRVSILHGGYAGYTYMLTTATVVGTTSQTWICVEGGIWGSIVSSGQFSSLNDAVSSIGSAETTLVIETWMQVTAACAIPDNISCLFARSGSISTSSWAVTGMQMANDPSWKTFDTSGGGSVALIRTHRARPEWWGAIAGDTAAAVRTANVAAIQSAIDTNLPVEILGIFYTDDSVLLRSYSHVYGHSWDNSGIVCNHATNPALSDIYVGTVGASVCQGVTLEWLLIRSDTFDAIQCRPFHSMFYRCRIEAPLGKGIYPVGESLQGDTKIDQCYFRHCKYGIYMPDGGVSGAEDVHITNCIFWSGSAPTGPYTDIHVYLETPSGAFVRGCHAYGQPATAFWKMVSCGPNLSISDCYFPRITTEVPRLWLTMGNPTSVLVNGCKFWGGDGTSGVALIKIEANLYNPRTLLVAGCHFDGGTNSVDVLETNWTSADGRADQWAQFSGCSFTNGTYSLKGLRVKTDIETARQISTYNDDLASNDVNWLTGTACATYVVMKTFSSGRAYLRLPNNKSLAGKVFWVENQGAAGDLLSITSGTKTVYGQYNLSLGQVVEVSFDETGDAYWCRQVARAGWMGNPLLLDQASDTGSNNLSFGATLTEGMQFRTFEEYVVIPGSVASVDLNIDIPSGSVVLGVQANLHTIITATTATKVGIGIAANPDMYGLTSGLTKNLKIDLIPAHAVLAGADDIQVFACDNAGAAAGTLDGGTVRVRIYYVLMNTLDNV